MENKIISFESETIKINDIVEVSFEMEGDNVLLCENENEEYTGATIEESLESIGFSDIQEIKNTDDALFFYSGQYGMYGSDFIQCKKDDKDYIVSYTKRGFGYDTSIDKYYIALKSYVLKQKEKIQKHLKWVEKQKAELREAEENAKNRLEIVTNNLKEVGREHRVFSKNFTKKQRTAIRFTIGKLYKLGKISFNQVNWLFNSENEIQKIAERVTAYTKYYDEEEVLDIVFTEHFYNSI